MTVNLEIFSGATLLSLTHYSGPCIQLFSQTTGTSMKFKIDEIHAAHEIKASHPPQTAYGTAGSTSWLAEVKLTCMLLTHDMTRDNLAMRLSKKT